MRSLTCPVLKGCFFLVLLNGFERLCWPQDTEQNAFLREVEGLRSEDPDRRAEAARRLIAAGKRAKPLVKKLLKDSDPDVRGQAKAILAKLPPEWSRVKILGSRSKFNLSPDGSLLVYHPDKDSVHLLSTRSWKPTHEIKTALPVKDAANAEPFAQFSPAFWKGTKQVYVHLAPTMVGVVSTETGKMTKHIDLGEVRVDESPTRVLPLTDDRLIIHLEKKGICLFYRRDGRGRLTRLMHYNGFLADQTRTRLIVHSSHFRGGGGLTQIEPHGFKIIAMEYPVLEPDWMLAPASLDHLYLGSRGHPRVLRFDATTLKMTRDITLPIPLENTRPLKTRLSSFALSPDGKWMAAATRDMVLHLVSTETMTLTASLQQPGAITQIVLDNNAAHVGALLDTDEIFLFERK